MSRLDHQHYTLCKAVNVLRIVAFFQRGIELNDIASVP